LLGAGGGGACAGAGHLSYQTNYLAFKASSYHAAKM
jgi:hypothetical protein